MRTKPTVNNALIEVMRDDDGVSRTDETEVMKYGRLVNWSMFEYHITASSGIELSEVFRNRMEIYLNNMIGKIVRWEEYAEGGQTFEEDGKTYALVPWWRLISFEESE
jgi:hypothetical protein